MSGRVLLLHGLWMHAPAMRWLAARLRAGGFDARTLGYFSVLESTDAAVARIAAALRPGDHVVAHSLGGLMALQAATYGEAQPGRIVCLGTPLAGSGAARAVHRRLKNAHLQRACDKRRNIPAPDRRRVPASRWLPASMHAAPSHSRRSGAGSRPPRPRRLESDREWSRSG